MYLIVGGDAWNFKITTLRDFEEELQYKFLLDNKSAGWRKRFISV